MDYRCNRRTKDVISVLGMGTSSLPAGREGAQILEAAVEGGINYFDLAAAESVTFTTIGRTLAGMRSRLRYQLHFGAMYGPGKSYGWSLNLDRIKASVAWQLQELKTDYIDYGFIHCLDEEKDWQTYQKHGVLQYLLDLKDQGVVHHLGFSTHTPAVANSILDMDVADMMLFSINAGYDYQHGEYARGSGNERMALYQRCEAMGVGISVMKPFSGGQLLSEKTSPFQRALSTWQCLQYVLDKPGVLTAVAGAGSLAQLENLLGFFTASAEEKDYSCIAELTPVEMQGRCVYCNHCQPCPAGIDVGLVNKYYDLGRAGDALAIDHYHSLEVQADACTSCQHCNKRCPFKVDQVARMQEIAAWFAQQAH